ncbi:MAG: NUDIX hydrolase [Chloroflexi bacterium]|nr:NUDIX hydrolase [Chloroflexota bacterium]
MKPWSVLSSRLILSKPPWLTITAQRCQLPNGHIIEEYLLAEGRDVVMVFPLSADGKVILVEQYKHGCGRVLWDLPAGYVDADDPSLLEAAQRELAEETGHSADDWTHLASLYPDPNRSANRFHFYLAVGARQTSAQHLDATEDINVHVVSPADLWALVAEGKIGSMSSVAGIGLGLRRLAERGVVPPAVLGHAEGRGAV